MLDLSKYQSIGAALKDALDQFDKETCLIEADREREKDRLTYRQFKERAHPLAAALQASDFLANDRAAIIMTNQSNWLISAYAIFFTGGVLVPLDYKLTPDEHWQLLAHSAASVLITEFPIWRQLAASKSRAITPNLKTVLVTEAPPNADLQGALRWEEFRAAVKDSFVVLCQPAPPPVRKDSLFAEPPPKNPGRVQKRRQVSGAVFIGKSESLLGIQVERVEVTRTEIAKCDR